MALNFWLAYSESKELVTLMCSLYQVQQDRKTYVSLASRRICSTYSGRLLQLSFE